MSNRDEGEEGASTASSSGGLGALICLIALGNCFDIPFSDYNTKFSVLIFFSSHLSEWKPQISMVATCQQEERFRI